MKIADVVVIGSGMVGLSLAAALKTSGLQIIVIDKNDASIALTDDAEVRVSALNLASERFLSNIGAWQHVPRKQAFDGMFVWEQDSFGQLSIQANTFNETHLGHIIENKAVQQALMESLAETSVEIIQGHAIESLDENAQGAVLVLDNQQVIFTQLVIGADGAHSWLRQQNRMPLTAWDYQHTAIVGTVKCAEPHQNIARQVFSPEGPLALLPLWRANECSFVWSVSPQRAADLHALSKEAFSRALSVAFDMKLGVLELVSERQLCPLTARYARQVVASRSIVIGDAAHTIHPLAGQGANLGLMDAAALAQLLLTQKESNQPLFSPDVFKQFERWRKSEAVKYLVAMESIKRTYQITHPLAKFARGIGMNLANHAKSALAPIVELALGNQGELPELAK